MRSAAKMMLAAMFCVCIAKAGAAEVVARSATMPSLNTSPKKLTATATRIVAAATQASTQTSGDASTQPGNSDQASAPTTFPTPAELIAKMRASRKKTDSLPHVAYFSIGQAIVERPPDFSLFGDDEVTTLRSLIDRLRKAKDDRDIRAVLITLGADSELNLAQAQEIRQTLSEISKSGKPTFVHADAFDTASYIAASGANHVCMLEGGQILLPGVGMEAMFAKGLLDKLGVKADYIQIGEYKGADEAMTRTGASEELRGQLNKLSEAIYNEIVETIATSRNLNGDDVREIIDESMMTGATAKKRGLVDHLVDQDGLRDLISKEIHGEGKDKKIEMVHNYGKAPRDEVDFSNPFALLASIAKQHDQPTGKPQVALIYLSGVIKDGEGGQGVFGGESAGSEELRKALRQAARDPEVKAVVLRIDSPGGSALASEVIWQAARHVQEKKPLIVSVGSMAASGGYYVASASDRIFADPGAIVGSIGVVGGKFVYGDLMAKLGLNTESFNHGQNANLFSSTQPFTDRQRKMVTAWMKETYDQFTQRVMTTRKGKIEDIDAVARGRIFSSKQGKAVGLVDEIGGLQQALGYAANKVNLSDGDYDIRVLPPQRTLADIFSGRDPGETQFSFRPNVTISPDSLLRALDRTTQHALGQQLQAMQLLQERPVLLITPYVISVR